MSQQNWRRPAENCNDERPRPSRPAAVALISIRCSDGRPRPSRPLRHVRPVLTELASSSSAQATRYIREGATWARDVMAAH